MGHSTSRQRTRKPESDESENEYSPAGSPSSKNSRESTDCCGPENIDRGPDTSRSGESGTPIYRDAAAQYGTGQRERDGPDRGYVDYGHDPDPQRLSDRYGFGVRSGQARTLQRLETEFGTDQVSRWADTGMTVEMMGKPRDMQAFRERQAKRPDAVPTDIERQNEASLQRNMATNPDERSAGDAGVPDVVQDVVSSPGQSLDETVQHEMEAKMGDDFGDVRVHTGPQAAQAADAINARAFTVGNHVAFNRDEYEPESSEGQRVLAHELTHVRQQTDGAVSMLPKAAKLAIDPDPELEREAEEAAQEVTDNRKTVTRTGLEIHVQRFPEPGTLHPGLNGDAPVTIQRDGRSDGTGVEVTEESDGKTPELFNKAKRHYEAGKYEKALTLFERVRQLPDLPDANKARATMLYNIGLCNLQLDRFRTAITYFEQHIAHPSAKHAKKAKADLKKARRRAGVSPEEGGTDGTEGEVTEGADGKARELFRQGRRHFAAEEYQKAITYFERSRNSSGLPKGGESELLYNIGLCNLRLGQFATAINYFEQATADPEAKDADFNTEDAQDRLEEARRGADIPQPKFGVSDRVKTTDNLRIRAGPGLDHRIEETTPIGVTGDVVAGPITADGYIWVKIRYDAGFTGWSAQPWLTTPQETGTAEGEESASTGDQETASTETGGSGSATQTDGGTSAGGASSTTPASGTGTSQDIPDLDLFEEESDVENEYTDNPRKVATFVTPGMAGDEKATNRHLLDLYFSDNFDLLLDTPGMEPLVNEIYNRILIPTMEFTHEPYEGEIRAITVTQFAHDRLTSYYSKVQRYLENDDVERAKYMGRLHLPNLEPVRTDRSFFAGFRKFRIRSLWGEEVTLGAAAGKGLLYEIEEIGPGKGYLESTQEGIPDERLSPPEPQSRRIGYMGFGGAVGYQLPVPEIVEKAETTAKQMANVKSSSWTEFETPVHMRLFDFEGQGGVAGGSAAVISQKELMFDCPDFKNVIVIVHPDWDITIEFGFSLDLTGGHWELDPDLGGFGEAAQNFQEEIEKQQR